MSDTSDVIIPEGLESFARTADQAERLWVTGGLYTYKATPSESGAYLACEVQAPDGFAVPVHFHDHEEEGFYVARGEMTVFLDGVGHRLSQGGFAFAARGVSHSFRFEDPDTALLLLISPGNWHEKMFREMGEPAIGLRLPDNGGPFDAAALGAIANTYGSHIVGPPPTR